MSSPDQLGGVTPGPEAAQAPDMWPTADPEAVAEAERVAEQALAAAEAEGLKTYLQRGGAFAELADDAQKDAQQGYRDEVAPLGEVDKETLKATSEYLAKKPTRDLMRRIKERREGREKREAAEAAAREEELRRFHLGLDESQEIPLEEEDDDHKLNVRGKYLGRAGLSRGNDIRVFAAEGLNPDGTEPAYDEPVTDETVADESVAA